VQAITATPRPDSDETRTYLLAGLLRCGLCGRLLDSHWVYRSPGYRCRHGHTSAHMPAPDRPKNIYVRQDAAINYAATRLGIPLDDPERVAHQLHATRPTIICMLKGMILRDIEEGETPPAPT
jgi:hypothetical protein